MGELCATFAVVTETWFSGGNHLDIESENLLLGAGINMIVRNRGLVGGLAHGVVAICSNNASTTMKEYKFNNDENYEVLAVSATVRGIKERVFIIAVYVPPGYDVPRGRGCLEHVNNLVLDIKMKFSDPLICIAGDFNQWKIVDNLIDFPDIREVPTPPTRNGRRIDKILCNWYDDIYEYGCVPPLETEDEVARTSDHLVQYSKARRVSAPKVKTIQYSYRPFSNSKAAAFAQELARVDWSPVLTAVGPNAKENEYQRVIDELFEKNFPMKTIKRRENDKPWFDAHARRRTVKKRKVYAEEGRSDRWIALRDSLDSYLAKRREKYLDRERENLTAPGAERQFFKLVKNYKTTDRPKAFDPRELFPALDDKAVAEKIADYFNEISHEFSPLSTMDIPTTYDKHIERLSPDQVATRLRNHKKPNSMVLGDVFPKLVNDIAHIIAVPLADVYNSVLDYKVWPIAWKREYVTVIPKKSIPDGLKDLRNISCTRFISKVFEKYILENALEEVGVKNNQYGGMKGCSTGHMLVEIVQQMCENAEDYRAATVVTAVDYAKAFNRLSFQHCLEAFRRKGSSSPIIRLIASFLTNRTMSVRIGEVWSEPRDVDGGCPQGSILGVLLFNITTDDLEDNFLRQEEHRLGVNLDVPRPPEPGSPRRPPPESGVAFSSPSLGNTEPPDFGEASPVGAGFYQHDGTTVQFRAGTRNLPRPGIEDDAQVMLPVENAVGTQVLSLKPVMIVKYIDDSVSIEKVNFGEEIIQETENGPIKRKQAKGSQNAYRSITRNALWKGMQVNEDKTKILCIADNMNYTAKVFIKDNNDQVIDCKDSMRVLGFDLSNRPTVHAHVNSVIKRLRQRSWSLRHLKKLGLSVEHLVKVYSSLLLPMADYCDYVYHSLMTDEQDYDLEAAQVAALRSIFGPRISGRRMREQSGLLTLRERRIRHSDKFAEKCINNPRFSSWFPLKQGRTSARNPEKYQEQFARCDRLRNSPLHYMRRRMNNKPGKTYGERYRMYRET